MNDLGPRSMDGFARPNRPVGAPQAQPPVRPVAPPPAPRPLPPRPIAADPRRVPAPPLGRVQQPAQPIAAVAPKKAKASGGWKVALQFVIGLLIIIGVAAAIVMLYIRYYQ